MADLGQELIAAYGQGQMARMRELEMEQHQREVEQQALAQQRQQAQSIAVQQYFGGDQRALDAYPMVRQKVLEDQAKLTATQAETAGKIQTVQGNAFELEQKKALTSAQLTARALGYAENPQAYANFKAGVEGRFPDLFPAGALPDQPPQGEELKAARDRATKLVMALSKPDLQGVAQQIAQSLGYGPGQEPDALADPKFKGLLGQYLQAEIAGKKKGPASQMVAIGGSNINSKPDEATGRDEVYLASLPPEMQHVVRNIADGKMPMPAATTRGGQVNPVAAAVTRYEPGFDSTTYQQRQTANKDFSAGGKAGQSLGAFNLAMQHAGHLMTAIDDLNNGSTPLANKAENIYRANRGDPRITRFNTIAHALAGEAGKIFRGSGQMTDQEQKALDDVLDLNASKAQQIAAAQTLVDLMKSRVDVLRGQWENAFRDTKPFSFITPEAQQILDSRFGGQGSASHATRRETLPSAPMAAPAAAPVRRIRITNGKQTGTVPEGTPLDPGWSIVP